jgi:SAM-dependent methyltransferase
VEQLNISVAPERANIEAAIHFARYAIGKSLVKGKRVLDIACGEGYGSYLLKQAGAEHVVGVDASSDSIARAAQLFGGEGVEFKAADAADLATLFLEGEFDVVISVETIEHLADPESFLTALKRVTKPGGVIILSCPNDHWYYPEEHQANPYHRRKYRLEEFQALCTGVLGTNVRWSVGTGVFGFGSTPLPSQDAYRSVPGSWMSYMDAPGAYLVSGERDLATTESQCSYFVGVWNAPSWTTGVAVFPLSMDDYATMVVAQEDRHKVEAAELRRALEASRASLAAVTHDLQSALRERRRLGLRWHASQAECATTIEALIRLQAEMDTYRIGYYRYVRITRLIPPSLRSLVVKIVRFFRSRKGT